MKPGDYVVFRNRHGLEHVLRVSAFRRDHGWELRTPGLGVLYTGIAESELTFIPAPPRHQLHGPTRTLHNNVFIPSVLMYSIPYKTYIYYGRYADGGMTLTLREDELIINCKGDIDD